MKAIEKETTPTLPLNPRVGVPIEIDTCSDPASLVSGTLFILTLKSKKGPDELSMTSTVLAREVRDIFQEPDGEIFDMAVVPTGPEASEHLGQSQELFSDSDDDKGTNRKRKGTGHPRRTRYGPLEGMSG